MDVRRWLIAETLWGAVEGQRGDEARNLFGVLRGFIFFESILQKKMKGSLGENVVICRIIYFGEFRQKKMNWLFISQIIQRVNSSFFKIRPLKR